MKEKRRRINRANQRVSDTEYNVVTITSPPETECASLETKTCQLSKS